MKFERQRRRHISAWQGRGFSCFRFSVVTFSAAEAAKKYPPTIVFMTDFGVVDDSVAICRGVMY